MKYMEEMQMFLNADDFKKVNAILEHYEKKIDLNTTIPLDEYEKRYQNVWAKMEEMGLDVGFFYWYR